MSDLKIDEIVDVVEEDSTEVVEDVITTDSPEWSEYVLDQMVDSELRDGNPTVDGLRRVTERVYGEIVSSVSDIFQYDTNQGICTVKHTLQIQKYETNTIITISGCVDVKFSNVPHPFNQHLVATADTRAEGKALRRALKLRTVTAEEMQDTSEDDVLAAEEDITDQQILAINQMCKRVDINLTVYVKKVCDEVSSVREVSNLQGRVMLKSLAAMQRKRSSIEENIIGYDANWRENFDAKGDKK
jgi:hypothetical protein|tara:strand:- start:11288 stop:12019 length:732 start_codon:yes stop_codon:yes gene_type:complete